MKPLPPKPLLYEINTAIWLQELSHKTGKKTTLSTIPEEEWDRLRNFGFHMVWLMGVWKRSPMGTQIALQNTALTKEFQQVLPDYTPSDVIGSPYCVQAYQVDERFGGKEGILKARNALHARGMKLILDFVPNHIAPDHPWTEHQPEYFVQGTENHLRKFPDAYIRIGKHIFARGKDPNFPAWQDVVQLNACHPGLRKAMIETLVEIGNLCDGLRVDMAMLMLNSIFQHTWRTHGIIPPEKDFWEEVIPAVKKEHPYLFFMAEAYWDTEPILLEQGFDACYDKRLYDYLRDRSPKLIRQQLSRSPDFQNHLVRFVENHDEKRAITAFPSNQWKLAALVTASTPGTFMLHEGQLEGRSARIPVFLGRRPEENTSQEVAEFYTRLLALLERTEFSGTFQLLPSPHPVLSGWRWQFQNQSLVFWCNPTKRVAYLKDDMVPLYNPLWAEGFVAQGNKQGHSVFQPFGFAVWDMS